MNLLRKKSSQEPQTTRVYKALKKAGRFGLYNHELSRICLSWHRRIGDLRKDGVNIQCVRLRNGVFKYYLEEEDYVKIPRDNRG